MRVRVHVRCSAGFWGDTVCGHEPARRIRARRRMGRREWWDGGGKDIRRDTDVVAHRYGLIGLYEEVRDVENALLQRGEW